jgi:hypothetical protein
MLKGMTRPFLIFMVSFLGGMALPIVTAAAAQTDDTFKKNDTGTPFNTHQHTDKFVTRDQLITEQVLFDCSRNNACYQHIKNMDEDVLQSLIDKAVQKADQDDREQEQP